jgi:hypothetical protein
MRVGVVDCGTNSIRLLIADIEGTNLREVLVKVLMKLISFTPMPFRAHLQPLIYLRQNLPDVVLKSYVSAQLVPRAMR